MTLPIQPYVSVDIETTGLDPQTCQVLELGAVIDDWREDVATLPKFRAILKHKEIHGDPSAIQMNAALIKLIATVPRQAGRDVEALTPEESMTVPDSVVPDFLAWLARHRIDTTKGFQPAGKNFASFDKPFLEQCVPRWKSDIKIRHRTIDPGNLFWRPGDEFVPDTKTCYQRAGLPGTVAHTAVEDAVGVVKLIRAYKARCIRETQGAKLGSVYIKAFGYVQAALAPDLVVDVNDPMGMARAIVGKIRGN